MHRRILLIIAATAAAAGAQSNVANPDLSNLAAGVLQQTRVAKQAIASHDRDSAIGHVKQAIATVNEIQQNAGELPHPLMIPISSQTETSTTVTPVHKNGDLKHNSAVRGVDGETSTTRLNLTAAADRLPVAEAALESGDWNAANAALGDVEGSTSVTQTTGNMPLNMARQNLELAKTRVMEGKYHDAVLPLRSAAQALGDYERRISGQQAANIETTRQAMLSMAAHITHEHDGAVGQIDAWTEMTRQWPAGQ
jgi:YfdX protein